MAFYAKTAGKATITVVGATKGSLQPIPTSFDITVQPSHLSIKSVIICKICLLEMHVGQH